MDDQAVPVLFFDFIPDHKFPNILGILF